MTQMSGHTSDHHSLMLQLLLCGCCIHLRIQVMYHLLQSVCRACLTIKYAGPCDSGSGLCAVLGQLKGCRMRSCPFVTFVKQGTAAGNQAGLWHVQADQSRGGGTYRPSGRGARPEGCSGRPLRQPGGAAGRHRAPARRGGRHPVRQPSRHAGQPPSLAASVMPIS